MRQLIITKEVLAKFAALKAGKEEVVELIDRNTDAPPQEADERVPFRVQGLVGGGVALFEPSREQIQKLAEKRMQQAAEGTPK